MLRVRFPGSDGELQERVFEKSPVRIGRDPGANEVVLPSGAVSRQHARLFFNEEEVSLIDASVNGTYVNGRAIDSYVMLGTGDEVILGDVQIFVDLVQADARFIEYVEHADQPTSYLAGQAYALSLAPRKCPGGAIQGQVVKADIHQELQAAMDLLEHFFGDLHLLGRES